MLNTEEGVSDAKSTSTRGRFEVFREMSTSYDEARV